MARKVSLLGETVKEYLTRFPNTANLTLAKKIVKETGNLFDSVEHCRGMIRKYRGVSGEASREALKDKSFFRTPENNYGLPKSDAHSKKPYVFPKASKRILWLSDIHVPYHDEQALKVALKYGLEHGADTIGINGDLMDCYHLSDYEKDPRKRNLKGELSVTREVLTTIRELFPAALIVFKEGNHEARWERYLMRNAPQLLDMEEFRLDVILKLRSLDIQFITGKRHMKIGKLNVIHGHEYKGGGAVHVARSYMLKTKDNVLVGHHHKTDHATGKKINGELIGSWAMGTLGELSPEYLPYNEWNHGFAFMEILDEKGNFRIENKKIYNGQLY